MTAPSPLPPRREFLLGVREIIPLAIGVATYGLAFGLLAAQAGMAELQTGLMGATVFAGASQIVAVERLVAGAGAGAALLAGLGLNLRLLLITASLRHELAGRPWSQKLLALHLAADENWALMHGAQARGRAVGYWYLVGGGACLLAVWLLSTVAGVTFARALPEPRAIGMDFAFIAAFIAILRGLWRGRPDLLPWVASAALTLGLIGGAGLAPAWALLAGGLGGAALAGVRRHG
ncbi:AzlC family ABC transporter permease [Roseospirillum parvum]|uniref:Predicted branched-chain amino acid permease (Azaleucine resistance) n=1 Tax=Roseospirillum parvum TaxID=83401 RepID=A0A1G7XT56_9PROT|nr:AzlC family ABC transporter permease [Roseospirillum parvum]SDG87321.1 Predicted branched-chain amino acid permease (azaleucine resistance) [Roseospirillum parvum]